MPGYEHAIVEQMGFALGVRESRRIRGLKTLDGTMVVDAVKQPDAVGHGFWCIDIHDPKGEGHTTWTERAQARMAPPVGESYHIPLGMCLSHTIPNLAVVGRCASATHEGLSSVRLQTHCMVMGQGVGTAPRWRWIRALTYTRLIEPPPGAVHRGWCLPGRCPLSKFFIVFP